LVGGTILLDLGRCGRNWENESASRVNHQ
jgi:hypothetical protein